MDVLVYFSRLSSIIPIFTKFFSYYHAEVTFNKIMLNKKLFDLEWGD